VFTELLKSIPLQRDEWRLYHWRDRRGREVDIVAENGNIVVAFEMKASSTVSLADFDNFDAFKSGPAAKWDFLGLIIYTGDQVLVFGDRQFAIPVSIFSSFPKATVQS
jgi:predicted AAA+ superfamily ATPase